jgi:hypothetical protein
MFYTSFVVWTGNSHKSPVFTFSRKLEHVIWLISESLAQNDSKIIVVKYLLKVLYLIAVGCAHDRSILL